MSKPKLISLSVFYKNDQPKGFGFTLTHELADLEHVLDTVTTSYRQMWNETEDKDELIADLLSQNESISKHHKEGNDCEEKLSDDDFKMIILAIGNVWLLEQVGVIKSDEFNGLLLGAEDGPYGVPAL